jgi:hypothetical protein
MLPARRTVDKGDGAMPTVVRGIDVSSHQPSDLGSLIRAHGPKHIVVRLYLPFLGFFG